MRRFSQRLASPDTLTFVPVTYTASDQGAPLRSYTAPGTEVSGSVQPRTVMRLEPNGVVLSQTVYEVYLFDDPTPLNASGGVQTDDAFLWRGLTLACQGPAVSEGGINALWRAECLAIQ